MSGINLIPAVGISSSALDAERVRMEVAAANLANAQTSRGPDGNVYQRRQVVFSTVMEESLRANEVPQGVKVEGIVVDKRPPIMVNAPFHPDADKNGMVKMPDITPMEEMMDMITATRAYEANLSMLRQSRDMARDTINMGRGN